MKSGKNIFNAFDVVLSTYENLELMLAEARKIIVGSGKYKCLTPDYFIRYKSDTEIEGWFTRQVFLIFQSNNPKMQNDLFVLEVNLYDIDGYYEEPMLELSKFTYTDAVRIKSEISKGASYYFYHPLYDDLSECIELKNAPDYLEINFTKELSDKRFYMGVKRIVCTDMPLVDITSKNIKEKILDKFVEMEKL